MRHLDIAPPRFDEKERYGWVVFANYPSWLAEDIKAWTHHQAFYFVGCFSFLFSFFFCPYHWFPNIHFSFHKQGYYRKNSVFPLGIFSMQFFNFQFQEAATAWRMICMWQHAAQSMTSAKQKTLYCVWSWCCTVGEDECTDSVLEVYRPLIMAVCIQTHFDIC